MYILSRLFGMKSREFSGEAISIGPYTITPQVHISSWSAAIGAGDPAGRLVFSQLKPIGFLVSEEGDGDRFVRITDPMVRTFWFFGSLFIAVAVGGGAVMAGVTWFSRRLERRRQRRDG